MGVIAGVAAAGLASSVAGMASGGGSKPRSSSDPYGSYGGAPATYIPQNQPGMDQTYNNIINQQYDYASSLPQQLGPMYSQYLQNMQGMQGTYGQGLQGAATTASRYLSDAMVPMYNNLGESLYNSGMGALPYGQQILTTGFDPRQQLYDRTSNQLQQQLAASNAASGVYGPQAAGTNAQALSNFNIDWQNQQLGRQVQATQGYNSLEGGAGRALQQGADFYGQIPGALMQSGLLPYQAYMQQQNDQLAALNNYQAGMGATYAPGNQIMANIRPYLQLGQSATSQGQAGYGYGQQMQGQNMDQIGRSLAMLSKTKTGNDWFGDGANDNYSDLPEQLGDPQYYQAA